MTRRADLHRICLTVFAVFLLGGCASATVAVDPSEVTQAAGGNTEAVDETQVPPEPEEPAESTSEPPESDASSGPSQSAPEPEEPAEPEPAYATNDSEYLFSQNELHTFEITVSEENLAFLDNDPAAEEYVPASLTFEGETLPHVGLRYKGSIGAFLGCTAGPDPFSPSGPKSCTKLSMKVKINFDGSEETFFGQKKLQFHALNLDPTLMHDRLGYHLFREMGVPAPRATHARIVVNGAYVGIFSFVEQVDGRFTRANFDDGKGNLYKDVWPLDVNGNLTSDEDLLDGLKTNEKDDPSFDLANEFAAAIAEATPEDRASVLADWMDPEQVARYTAVDRAIRHDDGPFHVYCLDEPCESHNFYLYEETDAQQIHVIPWDLDNAFENLAGDSNPVTPIADAWGEIRNDCAPFAYGPFGLRQVSAPCHPLLGAWADLTVEYEAARAELLAGPMSPDSVAQLLEEWSAQIEASVAEAAQIHDDAPDTDEWRRAVEALEDDLEASRS